MLMIKDSARLQSFTLYSKDLFSSLLNVYCFIAVKSLQENILALFNSTWQLC